MTSCRITMLRHLTGLFAALGLLAGPALAAEADVDLETQLDHVREHYDGKITLAEDLQRIALP